MVEYLSNRQYAAMETEELVQIERYSGGVHSMRAARELRKRAAKGSTLAPMAEASPPA